MIEMTSTAANTEFRGYHSTQCNHLSVGRSRLGEFRPTSFQTSQNLDCRPRSHLNVPCYTRSVGAVGQHDRDSIHLNWKAIHLPRGVAVEKEGGLVFEQSRLRAHDSDDDCGMADTSRDKLGWISDSKRSCCCQSIVEHHFSRRLRRTSTDEDEWCGRDALPGVP